MIENQLQVQNYFVGQTIGKGTFGKVKQAIHKHTQVKVAIKILEKSRIETKGDLIRAQREIYILRRIMHPYIIQLYEILESDTCLYLVMEYARGGELFDYISKRQKLKEEKAAYFFHQIIDAVEFLHNKGIVHRDLKPENILLDENEKIKLVDFGLSNTFLDDQKLKTACGSPCYAAPEMLSISRNYFIYQKQGGQAYDGRKTDIWSCGIILYAMLCGYLPFEDQNTSILYEKIKNDVFELPPHLSKLSIDLLNGILCKDPLKRMGLSQIRNHLFMKQVVMPKIQLSNDLDFQIIQYMESQMGFDSEEIIKTLGKHKHNPITATYYLLQIKKKNQKKIIQIQFGTTNTDFYPKRNSQEKYRNTSEHTQADNQVQKIRTEFDYEVRNLRGVSCYEAPKNNILYGSTGGSGSNDKINLENTLTQNRQSTNSRSTYKQNSIFSGKQEDLRKPAKTFHIRDISVNKGQTIPIKILPNQNDDISNSPNKRQYEPSILIKLPYEITSQKKNNIKQKTNNNSFVKMSRKTQIKQNILNVLNGQRQTINTEISTSIDNISRNPQQIQKKITQSVNEKRQGQNRFGSVDRSRNPQQQAKQFINDNTLIKQEDPPLQEQFKHSPVVTTQSPKDTQKTSKTQSIKGNYNNRTLQIHRNSKQKLISQAKITEIQIPPLNRMKLSQTIVM